MTTTTTNVSHPVTLRTILPAKRCTRCGETKQFEDFRRRAEKTDGRQSWCAACVSAHESTVRATDALAKRDRQKRLAVAILDPGPGSSRNRIAKRLAETNRVSRTPPGIAGVCLNCGETIQIVWSGEDDEGPCWVLIEPWGVIAYVEGPTQLGGGMPRVSWPLHRGCWMPAAGAAGAGVTNDLVLAVLRARESATANEIATGLGITRKMALSALSRLERHGAVKTLIKRDFTYRLGGASPLAQPSRETDRAILRMARENTQPLTRKTIMASLGLSRHVAADALRRLVKAEALEVTLRGESLYAAVQGDSASAEDAA